MILNTWVNTLDTLEVEFDESMHAGDDKGKNIALAPNVGEVLEK